MRVKEGGLGEVENRFTDTRGSFYNKKSQIKQHLIEFDGREKITCQDYRGSDLDLVEDRVSLFFVTDCDFLMMIHEDFPKPDDNI